MMGNSVNACVRCATLCHDRYISWKWRSEFEAWDSEFSYTEIQLRLDKNRQKTSTIFVAIQDKSPAEVLRHLKENPDSRTDLNSNDETPVHLACRLGYLAIVSCLLENGCPGDVVTRIGSPLHCLTKALKSRYVNQHGFVSTLHEIMGGGCDIDATDHAGCTVLYQAVMQTDKDCIRSLLDLNASVNIPENLNSFTPLHMATFQGDVLCLHEILKSPSVNLNAVDALGRTSLILALLNVLEWVQHEPWPNTLYTTHCTSNEPTLSHRYNKMAIVEALLMCGADPNIADSYERNPMVIAHGILALEMLRYGQLMGYSKPEDKYKTKSVTESSANVPAPPRKRIQESNFAPMVRLLVLYGAAFPHGHQQTSFMCCTDWMQKLQEDDSLGLNRSQHSLDGASESSPGVSDDQCKRIKLVHLCRQAIRCYLGKISKLQCIELLPLPPHLISYVQVKYI